MVKIRNKVKDGEFPSFLDVDNLKNVKVIKFSENEKVIKSLLFIEINSQKSIAICDFCVKIIEMEEIKNENTKS